MSKPYRFIATILTAMVLFWSAGCSSESEPKQIDVVAEINDFQLTKKEFQEALVKEMEYTETYKTTPEAKLKFLQDIIKKELFIQEAKKRGLDRKQEFTTAIERYWEATLIKHLMEEENKEIMQLVSVSENEIQQTYKTLKAENSSIPEFEKVEKDIAQDIFETKKTALLNQWIKSLYDDARIKINSRFINE